MGTIEIDGSTPKLTIGNATAEDALILFDGNAQDFYIALDDSADDLVIGLGSTVGTTPAISIDENLAIKTYGDITMTGTTPVLTIGDAGAEDTAIVFDGNAQDFYIALDDSADDLVIGLGSTVGTTPAISINSDRDVTISDGAIDFDVASHDTSNGLKLGGTLVTATAAELNIMDGVTATAAEINLIDGGTARGTTALADGDGILINDAGTMRMTNVTTVKSYMGGDNTPFFTAEMTGDQDVSDATVTKIAFNGDVYDTDSTYDTSNYRWTPAVAGYYYIHSRVAFTGIDNDKLMDIRLYKNGANLSGDIGEVNARCLASGTDQTWIIEVHTLVLLDDDDYIETFVYHNNGQTNSMQAAYSSFGGFKLIT